MEKQRKKLKELTIKDNFMFAAVMLDEENAKQLLELVLGIEIDHVVPQVEKSIVYNPEYKGVRLDVYLKDDPGNCFNIEMQAHNQNIERRARYYHSQIDMEMLASGEDYENLRENYVIFICNYDPLGLKKYQYTIDARITEEPDFKYNDGVHTVFLSTVGTNEADVPTALVKFLKFVAAPLEESEADYDDRFVKQLQNSVRKIKTSRDMENRYMLFEEMMRNEYKAGHEDGLAEGLVAGNRNMALRAIDARFTISPSLKERIQTIEDSEILSQIVFDCVTAATSEELEEKLTELLSDRIG